jgi:hypothetical protein
MEVPFCKMV